MKLEAKAVGGDPEMSPPWSLRGHCVGRETENTGITIRRDECSSGGHQGPGRAQQDSQSRAFHLNSSYIPSGTENLCCFTKN